VIENGELDSKHRQPRGNGSTASGNGASESFSLRACETPRKAEVSGSGDAARPDNVCTDPVSTNCAGSGLHDVEAGDATAAACAEWVLKSDGGDGRREDVVMNARALAPIDQDAHVAVRQATTLLPRQVLAPVPAVQADYISADSVSVVPIRARLRLCVSHIAEHRRLRHWATAHASFRCRLCKRSDVEETVRHVFMECSAMNVVRTATSEALAAVARDLDLAAIAGTAGGGDAAAAAAVCVATAPLLSAVRDRIRL
jgi:hypothetical protein